MSSLTAPLLDTVGLLGRPERWLPHRIPPVHIQELNPRPFGVKRIWGMSTERDCSDSGGRSLPVGDVGLNRSFAHGSTRHVICLGRVEASGCDIPGAMTSRSGADAAPGHLWQFIAALTMQWSVDRPGAPDVCLSKDQPHGLGGNCWSRGPKQSESSCDLIGWSVGCHQRLRSR